MIHDVVFRIEQLEARLVPVQLTDLGLHVCESPQMHDTVWVCS